MLFLIFKNLEELKCVFECVVGSKFMYDSVLNEYAVIVLLFMYAYVHMRV